MSQRGLALTTPALSYIGHFLEAKANSWFAPTELTHEFRGHGQSMALDRATPTHIWLASAGLKSNRRVTSPWWWRKTGSLSTSCAPSCRRF